MIPMRDALAIIREHQTKALPVDVVAIANALGMKVFSVPNWPADLSGMIRKNADSVGGFDIFVNLGHPVRRRRFTIAHEIAHAVLHPHLIGDGITDDALLRSGLSNSVEAQANKLAADILMPWNRLNEELRKGNSSVQALADLFEVSPQAMSIRLGVPQ